MISASGVPTLRRTILIACIGSREKTAMKEDWSSMNARKESFLPQCDWENQLWRVKFIGLELWKMSTGGDFKFRCLVSSVCQNYMKQIRVFRFMWIVGRWERSKWICQSQTPRQTHLLKTDNVQFNCSGTGMSLNRLSVPPYRHSFSEKRLRLIFPASDRFLRYLPSISQEGWLTLMYSAGRSQRTQNLLKSVSNDYWFSHRARGSLSLRRSSRRRV